MTDQIAKTFQYLYFLRFSLLLWLFPLVFALLDSGWLPISTTTLSRGIFVPEYWSGFLCVEFFLVSTGWVALITARVVVLNGVERYPERCPDCVTPLLEQHSPTCAEDNRKLNRAPRWLFGLFAGPNIRAELWAVILALVPSLLTSVYLILNDLSEGVSYRDILNGLGAGIVVAGFFWYFLNAWYYLAYERPVQPAAGELLKLGKNAARTILFPRAWFGLKYPGPKSFAATPRTLEDINTSLRTDAVAKLLSQFLTLLDGKLGLPGYVYENGQLYNNRVLMYESQLFSIIAATGFIALFWILCPLTAPRYTRWSLGAFAALFLALAWVLRVILSGSCPGDPRLVRRWQIRLGGFAGLFCVAIFIVWLMSAPDRFPTLAAILLMAIVLGWVFAGMAFFLDRYRFPVLTFCLLVIFVPRIFHLFDVGGFEEHYVSTVQRSASAIPLPTPAEIVGQRLRAKPDDPQPYLIITTTGGGLHASAWTARVLRQLYATLPRSFSSHILLFSTVSGGSTGLLYYLQEIYADPDHPDLDHMVVAAQCSSLEAVSWGLVYYDFARALIPGATWIIQPSRGEGDLNASPLGKDRTWALRRAFVRNSDDPYCFDSAKTISSQDQKELPRPLLSHWPSKRAWYKRLFEGTTETDPNSQLTIGQLPAIDERKGWRSFPAFTMNTTTVEAGDRFLLANYRLPAYLVGRIEGMAAESFLDLFCENPRPDLPLASAAQLSATFPYVSSAARIPANYTTHSVHFVDGGYYDNDGTASAIEFLRYALDSPVSSLSTAALQQDAEAQTRLLKDLGARHLRILLLEIRNSEDTDDPSYAIRPKALNPGQHDDPNPWPAGMLQQLGFPPEGFWNAGHGSVTGRNRNGLDLLRSALQDRLDLHQIIFDDETKSQTSFGLKAAQDPLSWSLTPRERAEVRISADPNLDPKKRLKRCYDAARSWFNDFQRNWKDASGDPEPTRCDL